MPACTKLNCGNTQSKLNPGGLCKSCNTINKTIDLSIQSLKSPNGNYNEINNIHNTSVSSQSNKEMNNGLFEIPSGERDFVDLIKVNMLNEKKHNMELIDLFKEQIMYLRDDIKHKNEIIKDLLSRIPISAELNINPVPSARTTNEVTLNEHRQRSSSLSLTSDLNTSFASNISPEFRNVDTFERRSSKAPLLTTASSSLLPPNRTHEDIRNNMSLRGTATQYPNYITPNTEDLHSSHPGPRNDATNITNKKKKVLILSDSICGRLDMRTMNRKLLKGHAYRQYHPGATTKQINHYSVYSLQNEKPDSIIINAGANNLTKDDSGTIARDIIDIVTNCHGYNVSNVYVSGITPRPRYEQKIKEVNDILSYQSNIYGFKFITNNNIAARHVWKDKIHLNDEGTQILGDNFVLCINDERSERT